MTTTRTTREEREWVDNLPEHRRAIHGRTWDRPYYPGDFDPIERPEPSLITAGKWLVLLALFAGIGVILAWRG